MGKINIPGVVLACTVLIPLTATTRLPLCTMLLRLATAWLPLDTLVAIEMAVRFYAEAIFKEFALYSHPAAICDH